MSDQLTLLQREIPIEIAILLGIIAIAVIAAVVSTVRSTLPGSEKTLRITGGILSGLGLLISGYVIHKTQILNEIPQCSSGSSGCLLVEKSEYSHIAGVHISIFGFVGYAMLLVTSILQGDRARVAGFILAFFGFGFSVYLTYLEFWEIYGLCQWCVTSAVTMTMLFVVNSARILMYFGLDDYPDDEPELEAETAVP